MAIRLGIPVPSVRGGCQEVRYFQPAENKFNRPPKLDGAFGYPDRWVYVICWEEVQSAEERIKRLRLIGGERCFVFVDGRCLDFWVNMSPRLSVLFRKTSG